MAAGSRIRLGMLALVLAASCGSRELTKDAGAIDSGLTGAAGRPSGAAGGGGPPTGSSLGLAGQSGDPGVGGAIGIGGVGGRGGGFGGFVGTGGIVSTGGIFGTGGIVTTGGVGGRGGFGGGGTGGSAGGAGRGGVGGTGGTGGMAGNGGTGGSLSGRGGFFLDGIGGAIGSGGGGAAGRGGTGGGGVSGTFGTGGGGVGGTSGSGGGGTGGTSGMGGGGMSGRGGVGGAGGGVCLTCRSVVLPIAAKDVVYSAARNQLYASVSGESDAYPNTIVVIDPITSSVTSTIPVGSNPRSLALADDGMTLWVGIDGAHAFRKVTLGATPVVGPLIHLPKAQASSYYDISTMINLPGTQPASLAAVLSDGNVNDVRLFNDGVALANGTANSFAASVLVAGSTGRTLFGAGVSGGFVVYQFGASGITSTTPYFGLLPSTTSSLVSTSGRVYADSGAVIDVSNPSAPFWTTSFSYSGPIALRDPQSLLMLTTTSTATFPFTLRNDIRIFATDARTQLASVPVPSSLAPNTTYYSHLVYAGNDGVAFIASDYAGYTLNTRLVIVHDPAFGTPTGGTGGVGGTGGAGGTGGTGGIGGTGGGPDPCPGCTFATVPAYGLHMAADSGRNLLYLAANAQALAHPSSIVTVDPAAAAVTSIVPVGNDPQPLALSDDGTALWVGLAGEHRVRRMTPGTTPTPGPVYPLPMLLTTGEQSIPYSLVVLPGTPASIAVGVYGSAYSGRGVFILDDGQPRANFVQPPEIAAFGLVNGPPGYLMGLGDTYNNLVVFRLGAAGATYESYGGLITSSPLAMAYSGGYLYASTGEVVDMTNPDNPVLGGRFAYYGCALALRSATRVMMLCPNPDQHGPILRMLDPTTFTSAGSVTLPDSLLNAGWIDFAYLGGDAIALLPADMPLQIMRAPFIATPP